MDSPKDLYSEYLFTSFKKVDGKLVDLKLHLDKLKDQVQNYYFLSGLDELFLNIQNEVEANNESNIRFRVNVFSIKRDSIFCDQFNKDDLEYNIISSKLLPRRAEVSLKTFNFYQDQTLVNFKLPNYAASFYLKRLAKNDGFDDILYLTPASEVLEASTSNIVFKINDLWVTPKACIYNGITRGKLITSKKLVQRKIELCELAKATDAYLINSIEEFVRVKSIDDKYFFKNEDYLEVFDE